MNLGNSGGYGATAQFFRVNELAGGELTQLVHKIAHRLGRYLERQGWLERDAEDSYLALDREDDDLLSVPKVRKWPNSVAEDPLMKGVLF